MIEFHFLYCVLWSWSLTCWYFCLNKYCRTFQRILALMLKTICSNKATMKQRLMINKTWSHREVLRRRGEIFVSDLSRSFVYISLGLYAYLSFMFILLYNIHRPQRSSLTFYSFIIDNGRRSSSSRHNNNNKRWNSNKNKNLLNSNSSR